MELGTHAKCAVKGIGAVRFQLELGGSGGDRCVVCTEAQDKFGLSLGIGGQRIHHLFREWLGSHLIEGIKHRLIASSWC